MIKHTLSVIFLVIIACLLQRIIPTFHILYDAKILIFPLLFLSLCFSLEFPIILLISFLCGFLWDVQYSLSPQGGNEKIYENVIESLPFGYSILLYALMGWILLRFQGLFRASKLLIQVLIIGATILLYLILDYLMIFFIRGNYSFTFAVGMHILFSCLLTIIFCPPILWIIHQINIFYQYDKPKNQYRRLKL